MTTETPETPQSRTGIAPVPAVGDHLGRLLFVVREIGMTSVLIGFICYMLSVQLPAIQRDFHEQTNKLVGAVENNNRVMAELSAEIKAMRTDRRVQP